MAAPQQPLGQRAHVAQHVRSFTADEAVAVPQPVKQPSRVHDGRRHARHYASAEGLYHPDVRRPSRSDFDRRTSTRKALPPLPGDVATPVTPVAATAEPALMSPSSRGRAASTPSWPLGPERENAGTRPRPRINTSVPPRPARKNSLVTPRSRPSIDRYDFATNAPQELETPLVAAAPAAPPPCITTSVFASPVTIATAGPSTVSIIPTTPEAATTPQPINTTTAPTAARSPAATTAAACSATATTAPSSAVPPASPASRTYSPASRGPGHRHTASFQTRYMAMLLALDKIPRLHNILASVFTWTLLAGFVVFPGSFTAQTSPPSPLAAVLLPLAAALTAVGGAGMLWLALRWRRNYVWLLNRVYMPGALSGLVGGLATLTSVHAHAGGAWGPAAVGAAAVEAAFCLACGALFVVYNNLLLGRVKREHDAVGADIEKRLRASTGSSEQSVKGAAAAAAEPRKGSVMTRLWRYSQSPPLAPGSVV